jgi:hypothetical protein
MALFGEELKCPNRTLNRLSFLGASPYQPKNPNNRLSRHIFNLGNECDQFGDDR